MNTDKLIELFKTEVEKLEKEAYERGKRDALKVDKLKTVKRIAKIGERVLITNAHSNIGYGNDDIGTVIEVVDRTGGGVRVNEWDGYVSYNEYEVIIEKPVQPLSANQQRKELIEQAREFITTHKNAWGHYEVHDPNLTSYPWVCNVEFVVNEEKRTVVALLKGFNSKKVYAKGIAKCHPDEVFNADIGKAVALPRALNKEVPEEFLNAVQPTELVKGQYVELLEGCGKLHIKGCIKDVVNQNLISFSKKDYLDYLWYPYDETTLQGIKKITAKIISDTNAKYEVTKK